MSSNQKGWHQTYLRVIEANLVEMEFRKKIEGMAGCVAGS